MTDGTNSCQAALTGANGISTGSCQITKQKPGSYTLTASYPGDPNFASSQSSPSTITVTRATSTTVLALPAGPVIYGDEQTATLTVTVSPAYSGTPTGTVTIKSAGVKVCTITLTGGAGTCSLSPTKFSAGKHRLQAAAYHGDAMFSPSSTVKTLAVTQAKSKTSLTLSAPTVPYGKERSLKFQVSVTPEFAGTPGGTVIIVSGQTTLCIVTLSGGNAECSPPSPTSLKVGKHTITAAYQGDINYGTSSATRPLTVTPGT